MIVKRVTTLELIKIDKMADHPKQTEQKLYVEIFIGSLRFTSPLFAFEGKNEARPNCVINSDIYFGNQVEFRVRQGQGKEILAHTRIPFKEFFEEGLTGGYIKLTLGDHSFFGLEYYLNFSTETVKEITQEDIEREIAEREEEARLKKLAEEEEARIKKELEELEIKRRLAEEEAKKAKYFPLVVVNKNNEEEPFY